MSMEDIYGGNGECLIRREGELPWPKKGKFPIMAWEPLPGNLMSSYPRGEAPYNTLALKGLELTKECGFNTILIGGTFEQMNGMINASSQLGIDVILQPSWLYLSPCCALSVYKRYKDNPTVVGWNIKDEPLYWEWGDYAAGGDHIWNQLTMNYGIFRSIDPGRLTFFNLCALEEPKNGEDPEGTPSQIKNVLGSFNDYTDYLNCLQDLFAPSVWCYDVYPFKFNDSVTENAIGTNDNTYIEYTRFFKYLKYFHNQSAQTGSPFWAFGESQGYIYYNQGSPSNGIPAPSAGMLRFEVLNALAFGAQGIIYWRFGQCLTSNNGTPITGSLYGDAPLKWTSSNVGNENNGFEKTDVWTAVRKANNSINFWKDIFMGCKVLAYGHAGKTFSDQPLLTNLGCILQIATEAAGVLLSWFVNDIEIEDEEDPIRRNFIAIVNHDPFHTQRISVRLDPAAHAQFILTMSDEDSTAVTAMQSQKKVIGGEIGPANPAVVTKILGPGDMEVVYWDVEIDYDIP